MSTLRTERIAILTFTLLLIGAGLWPQPGVHSRFDAAVELLEHRQFGSETDVGNSQKSVEHEMPN